MSGQTPLQRFKQWIASIKADPSGESEHRRAHQAILAALKLLFRAFKNLGSGARVYSHISDNETVNLRSIKAGTNVSVVETRNHIIISSSELTSDPTIIPFTLTATLALEGTATATNDDTSGSITVEDTSSSPGKFSGPSGYTGWARLNDATGRYDIVAMDRKARFILTTLTEDMGNTNPDEATATVGDAWDGVAPVGGVTVKDDCTLAGNNQSGDCLLCMWDDTADEYVVMSGDGQTVGKVVYFTLTATLAIGGSAAATDNDTGAAITVTDVLETPGRFTGVATDKGFARRSRSGAFQIIQMDHKALFIIVNCNLELTGGSAVATMTDFWDGYSPGTIHTIHDRTGKHLRFYQVVGRKFVCRLDESNDQYVIIEGTDEPSIQFGVAVTNWNKGVGGAPGTPDSVEVYHCDDVTGQNIVGPTYNVYFAGNIRPSVGGLVFSAHHGRPNVIAGDVVAFHRQEEGYFATTGYMDEAFGRVIMQGDGLPIAPGWQWISAMADRFPSQPTQQGDVGQTGGSDTITIANHAGASIAAAVAVSNHAAVNTSSTGISVAPHAEHYHLLSGTAQAGEGSAAGDGSDPCDRTGGVVGNNCGAATLSHSVSPNPHNHLVAIQTHTVVAVGGSVVVHTDNPISVVNRLYTLDFIIRIDNSAS